MNTISWRMAFLINLPFLLIAYLATVRFVPESRDEEATGRFDWLGSVVIAVAVAGLALGPSGASSTAGASRWPS